MEEDTDLGWIFPLLFFLFFFVWPIVNAIRKAVKEQEKKMGQAYERLQRERQAQLQQPQAPQLSAVEQERRRLAKAARKEAKRQQQQQRELTARFAEPPSLEQQLGSVEAGTQVNWGSVESEGLAHAFEGSGGERNLASVERTQALDSYEGEGRSLLVDLEAEKKKDFSEPVKPQVEPLARRLRHPQTIREVLIAGEIFKRPEY